MNSEKNSKLEQRQRKVLASLELLSEARAARLESRTSQSKPSDQAPPGYVEGKPSSDQIRDRSLYEWYVGKFSATTSDRQRRWLCLRAEHDLKVRLTGSSAVHTGNRAERVTEEQDVHMIVNDLQGVPSEAIALDADWPIGWVRTIRDRAGQNPDTGEVRPNFLSLDNQGRVSMVQELMDEGLGSTRIAKRLGVAKRTAQRYMDKVVEITRLAA